MREVGWGMCLALAVLAVVQLTLRRPRRLAKLWKASLRSAGSIWVPSGRNHTPRQNACETGLAAATPL